ncbi:MAG: hypothetical protein IJ789_08825 [Bacteroidales bacterium]|nr:hypothetical protein [Bacteroidales bacterium]
MKRPLHSSNPSFSTSRDENKFSSSRLNEKTFNKKRFWLVIASLVLVEAIILCFALQWKYILPSREVSDIYSRYKNVDGLNVSYIKDYKVNDTVFVDATIIEATTDSTWLMLQHDFNLELPPLETIDFMGHNFIEVWAAPKRDYSLPMDSVLLNNDILTVSWSERRISIFSIETMQQMHSLKCNQFEESISKSQK